MNKRSQFLLVVLLLHLPLFAYPILRLCYWLGLDGVANHHGFFTTIFQPDCCQDLLAPRQLGIDFLVATRRGFMAGNKPFVAGYAAVC